MWGVLLEILCYLSHTDEVFRWPASPKCLLPRPDRALTLGGLKEPGLQAGFFHFWRQRYAGSDRQIQQIVKKSCFWGS